MREVDRLRDLPGRWVALLMAMVPACGDTPAAPDVAPTITIVGVADGETRDQPVTITIAVDRGTYVAQLNGEPFLSGRTISTPDDYALSVTARNGEATSSREVRFTIVLAGDTRLIVRMFDLGANASGGGGDAVLLTDSSSAGLHHAVMDAGPAGIGGADSEFVWRRLTALGVDTVEVMILSHAHTDHFGGMTPILERLVVRRFVFNGQERNFATYTAFIADANRLADTVITPGTVTAFALGSGAERTMLSVIPPLTTFLANRDADGSEINEGSLGAEVVKGGVRLFFTGDGEVRANARWRGQFATHTAALNVLKVGHHGANDAIFDNGSNGTSSWLTHAAPEVAVVSANGSSHPRSNAVSYLLGLGGTRTYCTNVHGDIEIRIGDRGTYVVSVERNAAANCSPGSDNPTDLLAARSAAAPTRRIAAPRSR